MRALFSRIGTFIVRGWAQRIADRWRDAVLVLFPVLQTTSIFLLASSFVFIAALVLAALICMLVKHLYIVIAPPFPLRIRNPFAIAPVLKPGENKKDQMILSRY